MSGCCVVDCINEAHPDHGFQQIVETRGVRIKTTVLLCEDHWQLLMESGNESKTYKIKYCVECGKAAPRNSVAMLGCPICKETVCFSCATSHEKRAHAKETQGKEEEETHFCAQCKKKLSKNPITHDGKMYCADCYILNMMGQVETWRYTRFANDPEFQWKTREWQTLNNNNQYTWDDFDREHSPETWLCRDCKKTLYKDDKKFVGMGPNEFRCETCYQREQDRQREGAEGFSRMYETFFSSFGFGEDTYDSYTYNQHYTKPPFGKETYSGPFTYQGGMPNEQKKKQTKTQTSTIELPTTSMQAFAILGIAPTTDIEKIKKAYRKLATQYHPDKPENKGREDKMKQVNVANDLAMKYAGKR